MIYPFIRERLDILFVGLNPANTSSKKGHYFSTNPAFWNQLYDAGLITVPVDLNTADEKVFGSSDINYKKCQYGVTDLVNYLAESNSSKVKPTLQNCVELEQDILKYKPKIVVLMHSKVFKFFVEKYKGSYYKGYGCLGKLIDGCDTIFYNVPFPHGNSITSEVKIALYKEIKKGLDGINR